MANSTDMFMSLIQGFNPKPSYQPQAMNFDNFNPGGFGQALLGTVNKGVKDYNTNELLGQYMANADEGTLMQLAQTNPEIAGFLLEKRKLDAQLAPKAMTPYQAAQLDIERQKLQQGGSPFEQAINARVQQLIEQGVDPQTASIQAYSEGRPANVYTDAMGNMIRGQTPFGDSLGGQPSQKQAAYQGTGLPRVTADNVDEFREKYIAQVETGGIKDRDNAVSPKGAVGYNQIMPETFREFAMRDPKLKDAEDWKSATKEQLIPYLKRRDINNYVANGILTENAQKYGGDPYKVAAAYNAGAGAVDKYNGVPPYKETQNYIRKMGGIASGGSPFEQKAVIESSLRGTANERKQLAEEEKAQPEIQRLKTQYDDAFNAFWESTLQPGSLGEKTGITPLSEEVAVGLGEASPETFFNQKTRGLIEKISLDETLVNLKALGGSDTEREFGWMKKVTPDLGQGRDEFQYKIGMAKLNTELQDDYMTKKRQYLSEYGDLRGFKEDFSRYAQQKLAPENRVKYGIPPKPLDLRKSPTKKQRIDFAKLVEQLPIGAAFYVRDTEGKLRRFINDGSQ